MSKPQPPKALAGMVDAGAASASTFIAAVVAARILPVEALGAYALVFSIALLAGTLPQQLIGVPARARLIDFDARVRISSLPSTLWLGAPFSLFSSALVVGVFFVISEADMPTRLALTATGALYAAAGPLNEHARAMFHLGGKHWTAAGLSFLRLMFAVVFLAVGTLLDLMPALLPFGALAAADIGVIAMAALVARRTHAEIHQLKRLELVRAGRWLFVAAALGPAAGFIVNVLVTHLAGPADLGFAESARIVAQPVLVLAVGLAAVAGPGVMEAARAVDRSRALHIRRSFNMALGLGAAALILICLLPKSVNPVMWLVPVAFEVPGLAILSIAAALFNGTVFLQRSELVVAERGRDISSAEAVASMSRIAAGIPAVWTKAWAVPLSFLAGGIARTVLLGRHANRIYETS